MRFLAHFGLFLPKERLLLEKVKEKSAEKLRKNMFFLYSRFVLKLEDADKYLKYSLCAPWVNS